MGLWDKKSKFDDDLSAPAALPTPAPAKPKAEPAARPPEPRRTQWGVDRAVALMNQLPEDNEALVTMVVARTMEAAGVTVQSVIDDATQRQAELQARIGMLRKVIKELQQKIADRRIEVGNLEADLSDATRTKERLVMGQSKLSVKAAAPEPKKSGFQAAPGPESGLS